jgi:hypothetical protein
MEWFPRIGGALAVAVHVCVVSSAFDSFVAVPSDPQVAGEMMVFSVRVVRRGLPEERGPDLPSRLTCRLTMANAAEVVIHAERAPAGPHTNGWASDEEEIRTWYELRVPEGADGPVQLVVDELDAPAVAFLVVRRGREGQGERQSFDSFFGLYQPYLANIAAYEPMYFLLGTRLEDSKYQLSFKYRFYNPRQAVGKSRAWLSGVHFAYVQTSFWNLASDSEPFEDTSYKPELFYLSSNLGSRSSWIDGLFVQTGYQHESNGRGGEGSRDIDHIYVRPVLVFYDADRNLGLEVAPKVWVYAKTGATNPDIARYRGYFQLDLKLGRADSFVLGSSLCSST